MLRHLEGIPTFLPPVDELATSPMYVCQHEGILLHLHLQTTDYVMSSASPRVALSRLVCALLLVYKSIRFRISDHVLQVW